MYAILAIQIPDFSDYRLDDQQRRNASNFVTRLPLLNAPSVGVSPLGEYVWQIDLNSSYSFLAALTTEAARWGISYKILFLDQELHWITG
jgi:hypothetical protein